MDLVVRTGVRITQIRRSDKLRYVELLRDPEIAAFTLAMPYPYTETHAEEWLCRVEEETQTLNQPINFAIRDDSDGLIGGIGFHDFQTGHRAELGYWIGKAYWGQGIMTEAVKALTRYGFEELGLVRVYAHVFTHNHRSAKVLQKAGFSLEGILRRHHKKGSEVLDAQVYACLSDSPSDSP